MRQHLTKSLLALVVTTAALAGCGGGGGGGPTTPEFSSPFSGTSVDSLLAYMNSLIDRTSETTEPVAVDNKPLPVDDTL